MTSTPRSSHTKFLLLGASLSCALVASGCGPAAGSPSSAMHRVDPLLHQAQLGATLPALEAAKSALYAASPDMLIFEQARHAIASPWTTDELDPAVLHDTFDQHLDMWGLQKGKLALALVPGAHLSAIDQPPFDANGDPVPNPPDVFIDFVAAPCDGTAQTGPLEQAHRVEVDVTAASRAGWVQLQVEGYRAGETTPFAVGRFIVPEPSGIVLTRQTEPGSL